MFPKGKILAENHIYFPDDLCYNMFKGFYVILFLRHERTNVGGEQRTWILQNTALFENAL